MCFFKHNKLDNTNKSNESHKNLLDLANDLNILIAMAGVKEINDELVALASEIKYLSPSTIDGADKLEQKMSDKLGDIKIELSKLKEDKQDDIDRVLKDVKELKQYFLERKNIH